MHFQSATPCVRHDHALSARGGDFIAWSLSLTGLVNAYWPDWHTSSRKLTKWCLTDNFGTIFIIVTTHIREEIISIFCLTCRIHTKIVLIPFPSFTASWLYIFSCITKWSYTDRCDWQELSFRIQGLTLGFTPPCFLTRSTIIGLASSPQDSNNEYVRIH